MKLSSVKADSDLSVKGVWRPFGAVVDGVQAEMLIAYSGNENYRSKLAKLTRNAATQMPGRDIPAETYTKLNRDAMIGTVLLGWRNIENDDGSPISDRDESGKVHDANARQLLNVMTIFDFVSAESSRLDSFQKEVEDTANGAIKSGAPVEPQVGK